MNTYNVGQLQTAAESGDINLLYTVIRNDPSIFEHIDLIPFVETPLHIAASKGHLQFATEIMMLKPSFSWKLNVEGFSPIHLAMKNGQTMMVSRFVNINKELVKVQGREGITPLHLASQIGEVDLLASFLDACPESIEYLTARQETALHIAVRNDQFQALQVLLGWLKTNCKRAAKELEKKILNQKDEAGNTILHISAELISEPQARLLVKTGIDLTAKNVQNKTALDIATTAGIKKILLNVGAKPASEVTDTPTLADRLRSNTTIPKNVKISMSRIRRNIIEEQRNTWLIVATLVATATYQSSVSPPGGVYQANASDNTVNITSSNSTIITPRYAGESVLSNDDFYIFFVPNMLSFLVSIITILCLTPSGIIGRLLMSIPIMFFVFCYLYSMAIISPTAATAIFFEMCFNVMQAACILYFVTVVYSILQKLCMSLLNHWRQIVRQQCLDVNL